MTVRELLIDTYAHIPPARALEALAADAAERRVAGAAHSVAELVAHMAFWQDWFCARCQGSAQPMAASAALGWPAVEPGSWMSIRDRFVSGLERSVALGADATALAARVTPPIEFPPLARYTVRDALVHISQHNAHHLGQVILLRQMMGLWPPPSGSWTW